MSQEKSPEPKVVNRRDLETSITGQLVKCMDFLMDRLLTRIDDSAPAPGNLRSGRNARVPAETVFDFVRRVEDVQAIINKINEDAAQTLNQPYRPPEAYARVKRLELCRKAAKAA